MFGCKQSGGRSQALCLCLRLLRQLGASQEASPGAGREGQRDGQTDGTRGGASVRRGLYCGVTARGCGILWFRLLGGSGSPRGCRAGGSGTFGSDWTPFWELHWEMGPMASGIPMGRWEGCDTRGREGGLRSHGA